MITPALTGLRLTALTAIGVLAIDGCSESEDQFTVLAASSLTDVVPELTEAFAAQRDGIDVVHDFAGSNVLATQVIEGRPFDVLLTANEVSMSRAVDEDAITSAPVVFARNRLTIVVPDGNPGQVTDLADLADPNLLVAICAKDVPCGALTAEVVATTGVEIEADTFDPSVRSVLTRVQAGSVDAGLVYVTDALAAGTTVRTIPLPESAGQSTAYLVAANDPTNDAADAFIAYLASDDARRILADAGFEQP